MAYLYPVAAGAGVAISVAGIVWLTRRARGKSLALLGPRKAGKTTLARFLGTGEIPRGYRPTSLRDTIKARRRLPGARSLPLGIKMRDVALKLTILDNAGGTPHGETTHYGVWRDSAGQVDAICYLVNVVSLSNARDRAVAVNGARHIARWESATRHRVLILTHTDLDPAWVAGDPDEITSRQAVKDLRRELQAEDIIMGTLKDEDGARDITYSLLHFLAR